MGIGSHDQDIYGDIRIEEHCHPDCPEIPAPIGICNYTTSLGLIIDYSEQEVNYFSQKQSRISLQIN